MIRKTITKIGTTMESTDTTVAVTSSIMLTGTFPAPAVVAVTAGRTTALFTACTPPATNNPQARERMGDTSVNMFALAANTIAPAVGLIND